ncbi:hypothetical protein GCM10009716_20310 [Streptomyces sodiiphilus]|uniref:Alpha-galactosidase n=1 Tax=Streptomyces sodiiphilus TaxID=226217 RepID=A0ABP5ACQ4_9ACTN
MSRSLVTWSGSEVTLHFAIGGNLPVSLLSLRPAGSPYTPPAELDGAPLVEVQALGHGRSPGSHRYAGTVTGSRLRYARHTTARKEAEAADELRVEQSDPVTGLMVTSVFQASDGVPAVRTWTEVRAEPDDPGEPARTLRLQAVTSLVTGAFLDDAGCRPEELDLLHGDSDWAAESRWHRIPLRGAGPADRDPALHPHAPRGRFALTSRSSWSTGEHLPTGALLARDGSWALSWQIEHNGAWHWEVGERKRGAYLALLGPTDAEHQWSRTVTAQRGFSTVPVSLAVAAGGLDEALGALTRQRRALHRGRPGAGLPVVFHDWGSTRGEDPTAARLRPLVDAAARAGADCFCLDAGWCDEDGRWWDIVEEWQPSRSRFPAGLEEVVDRIRGHGMVPGIRLEPEAVGVRSPVARRLPDEAFFLRDGQRVVEHGRYHLDLRHPRARGHLNEVIDRLVTDLDIGCFTFDYGIMPGPGTDRDGAAPGDGLLAHNRAHLAWLDTLLSRYPDLLVENRASGAMRMDYAMLSRLHLQSVSNQRNPLFCPPIVAAAPASVLPEQAGNRASPRPGTDTEETTFTLAGGILGRLCLSGPLDGMTPGQTELIREAVTVHKQLRSWIARSLPLWPLGLAGPSTPWVVQGLRSPEARGDCALTVWRRPGAPAELEVPVAHLRGAAAEPQILFPAKAGPWDLRWDAGGGVLRIAVPADGPVAAARVIRLSPS